MNRGYVLLMCFLAASAGGANHGGATAAPDEGADTVLIQGASIWDGRAAALTAPQDVLIRGNLIAALGDDVRAEFDTVILDGRGLTLMPGIIDAHTHLALPMNPQTIDEHDPGYVAALSVRAAEELLMRGWTTVRDIGGPSQGLAKAIDEGVVAGPRIYTSAMFISQTSGHADYRALTDGHPNDGGGVNPQMRRYALLADGPDEVRRAVRESLRQGATAIKVMAGGGISSDFDPIDTKQYSVDELRAAVSAAADWNTYVAVHAYTDDAVLRALEAGVKVIEHGHLLTEPVLKRLRRDGAFLSSQSFGFVREFSGSLAGTARGERAAQVMAGTDALMSTARRLGIPVAFGTDAFGSLRAYRAGVREFGYRLRWFESLEILRQATSHNAKLLALTGPRNPYPEGPLGVIEPGAYADVILVDGNPLEDVRLLEDHATAVRLVVKDGRIYKNLLDVTDD